MQEITRLELLHIAAFILSVFASVLAGFTLGGISKRTLIDTEKSFLILRLGVAFSITMELFFVLLFSYQVISYTVPSGHPKAEWIERSACFVLLLLITGLKWRPLSLFPEDSGVLMSADRSQQRKFTLCLWRLLFTFFFFALWICFLIVSTKTDKLIEQVVYLIFSLVTMSGLFYYGKISVKTVYERLETIIDQQYKSELLNFMQVIRSQRHDFNFHMQAVAGMIENRRYKECDQYVRTMVKNVERLNDVLPLKNPAISALINTFIEIAASRGIRLEIQILDQMNNLPCTIYEINTVLGNLLQNAIDESEGKEINNRWIKLLIMKRSRRQIIKISNPCEKNPEDYREIFHPGYSTKKAHEGIGLVTVKKITMKYSGAIYLEHEPGVIHFIVRIPLTTESSENWE